MPFHRTNGSVQRTFVVSVFYDLISYRHLQMYIIDKSFVAVVPHLLTKLVNFFGLDLTVLSGCNGILLVNFTNILRDSFPPNIFAPEKYKAKLQVQKNMRI